MTKHLLLFSFLLLTVKGFSQSFTVKGKVITTDKQSIEFAEVSLIQEENKLYETFTDNSGFFEFEVEKSGTYTLYLDYFGTNQLKKELFVSGNLDLGNIVIEENTALESIVIETQRKQIEKKVDRLIFNVSSSIQSSGSDALELLKITPRIKVQNDQISMIGKSSMKIMIDDRVVQLSGDELTNYLRSLRSDDIQNIEVITNPPAKYSAEGNSGIINIVTKKSKIETWNASILTNYKQATYPGFGVSGSFNYKKKRLTLTFNTNYYNGSTAPVNKSTIEYPSAIWKEINNRHDFTTYFSSNLGIDYKISEKVSTGFTYRYSLSDVELRSKPINSLINTSTQTIDSLIITPGIQFNDNDLHSLNYHLVYNIDSLKRKLSFDFDFFNFDSKSDRTFDSGTYLPNNLNNPISFYAANNIGNQKIDNYSLNLDMEHPTRWMNLNYGIRFSSIKTQSGFEYYNLTNGFPEFDSTQSNQFIYKENTQAAYFSVHKEWSEKWETKIGLRLENTQTKGNSLTLAEKHQVNYTKLFPTAYVSYNANDDNAFTLSYSRRINRPNYGMLDPFRWISSAYSYSEGNPYLQPAFTDNLEFEYMLKENFITSVYFSYMDDDFEQLVIIDPETKIQQSIPQNFIVNKTFGINQTVIFKPVNWWNVNLYGTVYYSSTTSKVPVTLQYLKGWNGEFSVNNDFTLNNSKTLFFNLRYSYVTKGVDNLDYNSAFDQLNASFKGLFFDKKLIVSLHGNDIFSSNRATYTGYSNGIKNAFMSYWDSRFVRLSLAYNFGKTFQKENRQSKNSEELNRTN